MVNNLTGIPWPTMLHLTSGRWDCIGPATSGWRGCIVPTGFVVVLVEAVAMEFCLWRDGSCWILAPVVFVALMPLAMLHCRCHYFVVASISVAMELHRCCFVYVAAEDVLYICGSHQLLSSIKHQASLSMANAGGLRQRNRSWVLGHGGIIMRWCHL